MQTYINIDIICLTFKTLHIQCISMIQKRRQKPSEVVLDYIDYKSELWFYNDC